MKFIIIAIIIAAIAFWVGRVVQRGKSVPPQQQPKLAHDKQAEQRLARLPSKIRMDMDALIRRGDRINAVKLVKESTDHGLKESKEMIDERARQLGL